MPSPDPLPAPPPDSAPHAQPRITVVTAHAPEAVVASASAAPVPTTASLSLPAHQAVETLVSPQASFEEKQAAWGLLRDSGKLDQAITEFEQRASASPTTAEYPATLGQAYLQKAGTLKDLREQGILGLKADQSFDAALNLDPANWEAGFWKATAMSYWPPQLGKSQEIIDRFLELIKLQETRAPQPQFAQTYATLGDQYQKQGYPDYAKQVWQRGAALFPNDTQLQQKLENPASTQTAAR